MYCIIMIEDNKAQLCTARLFETAEDAAEASAKSWEGCGVTVHRWFGGVSTDNAEGRPLAMWGNAYPKPVHVGARVLPLPEPAAGCRSEHAPLLAEATRWLGAGLPLDALATTDEDGEGAWEIIDETPRTVSVTLRADFDGEPLWHADESCQDSGEDWPEGINVRDIGEAAEAWAADNMDPPSAEDYEQDEEGGVCYLALSEDGEIIDAFDSEDDAEDAARQQRDESRYGYPWAHGWAYYIDEDQPEVIADLQAAGFTVARQTATGYLFAGIDGGGYDFKSAHHVRLAARRMAHRGALTPDGAIPVGPPRSPR